MCVARVGLRADQVLVRTAIRQGGQRFLDSLVNGFENGRETSRLQAAGNPDGSSPHVVLLVDAQLVNFGTVKSIRDKRVRGVNDNFRSSAALVRSWQ